MPEEANPETKESVVEQNLERHPTDDDIVAGIDNIAREIPCSKRRAQWLWETGRLPFAFKWGKKVCATRGGIRDYKLALERGDVAAV